ncbi:hypothetical protein [Desulfurobacterium crinifex]
MEILAYLFAIVFIISFGYFVYAWIKKKSKKTAGIIALISFFIVGLTAPEQPTLESSSTPNSNETEISKSTSPKKPLKDILNNLKKNPILMGFASRVDYGFDELGNLHLLVEFDRKIFDFSEAIASIPYVVEYLDEAKHLPVYTYVDFYNRGKLIIGIKMPNKVALDIYRNIEPEKKNVFHFYVLNNSEPYKRNSSLYRAYLKYCKNENWRLGPFCRELLND